MSERCAEGAGCYRGKSPWNQYTNFCCFPYNLTKDDLHLYGSVSFEINQHRRLIVVRLRSPDGINGLVFQKGASANTPVRATRMTSAMIFLIVAFTRSTCGSARSSFRPARETVHRLEYAAFLNFVWGWRVIKPQ